jgi:enoyl-CoA hydratase/carnithine racemase
LLQDVVETKDTALRRAAQLAEQIGAGSPTATRLVIGAVEQGASRSLAAGLAVETSLFARSIVSADAREGIEAFFDKRPPSFDGQ